MSKERATRFDNAFDRKQNRRSQFFEAEHLVIDQQLQSVGSATVLKATSAFEGLEVLVDGNRCPNVSNCRAIIKGDLTEPSISAASIIAKVARDKQMRELDVVYPEYGFARHKGYGTKAHMHALQELGPIPGVHRFSFAPVRRATG